MKSLFLFLSILGICLAVNTANAQDPEREAKKKEKQEQREMIRKQNTALVAMAIDSSTFVLEANRLQGKHGEVIHVSSNLNFIAVNHESIFIQIGSNEAIGFNGVGGISVDSRITKMDVKKNEKNGSYTIQINCMSSAGNFDISISSNNDGQSATATIGGAWSFKLTYLGKLVPLPLSTVFKGWAL